MFQMTPLIPPLPPLSPLLRSSVSSGLTTVLGDSASQLVTAGSINPNRTLLWAALGFGYFGPLLVSFFFRVVRTPNTMH